MAGRDLSSGDYVLATSVGCACDGKVDDAAALNAALQRHKVMLPDGVTLVGSKIVVPSYSGLAGISPVSTILRRSAAHSDSAIVEVPNTSKCCELLGFQIDGNYSQNARLCDGLVVNASNASQASDPFPNANVRAERIHAHHITGNGFSINSGNVSFYRLLTAFKCNNYGMYYNTQDSALSDIDIGSIGRTGFVLGPQGYNNKITGLKVWYTGELATFQSDEADGIEIRGYYNQLASVEVQNAGRYGIRMNAARHCTISAINIELCGKSAIKGQGLVYEANTSDCMVHGNIHNRAGEGHYMEYAIMVYDPSAIRNGFIGSTESGAVDHWFVNATSRPSTTILTTTPGKSIAPWIT